MESSKLLHSGGLLCYQILDQGSDKHSSILRYRITYVRSSFMHRTHNGWVGVPPTMSFELLRWKNDPVLLFMSKSGRGKGKSGREREVWKNGFGPHPINAFTSVARLLTDNFLADRHLVERGSSTAPIFLSPWRDSNPRS
jgi:hypothetical protein